MWVFSVPTDQHISVEVSSCDGHISIVTGILCVCCVYEHFSAGKLHQKSHSFQDGNDTDCRCNGGVLDWPQGFQ